MDQPDDFEFEYDVDEAVRQFVGQYPCEGNAHCMEDDPVDRRKKRDNNHWLRSFTNDGKVAGDHPPPGILETIETSTYRAGSFEIATPKADNINQPSWEPSWVEERLPTHPAQTPPNKQNILSTQTAVRPQSNLDPSANFQFLSGTVILEDRFRASKQNRSLDENSGFKCEHPSCTYRGSFNRKYELQKHSLKHTARTKYQCPIDLCRQAFYRTDKLRLHLRQSHKDDEKASCPIRGCEFHGLPWIIIRLHFRNHDYFQDTLKFIGNLDSEERGCPLPSCQQIGITARSIREHLQSHNVGERIENEKHILEAGHDPVSANVCCPVCQTLWATNEDFEDHVQKIHIVKDWAHLHKFRSIFSKHHNIPFWTSQEVMWFDVVCCADMNTDPKHHLKYLQDPESLRPYRITLLKLWPELGTHPIFDDIMPKVQRISCRYK